MKRSDEKLDQQLQQWYQQSRQQQGMPDSLKKQLKTQMVTISGPGAGWQLLRQALLQFWSWRNMQVLTAVLALGVGWQLLQQDPTYYQISQSNDVYPVQVHQLTAAQTTETSAELRHTDAGQRRALYTQKYQDYLRASKNNQIQRQLIVTRQFSEEGWHLDLCQQMQLQLTSEWLAQFKLQHHWTESQWQQLQRSDWLQITTGGQGQILALQQSAKPPACAP